MNTTPLTEAEFLSLGQNKETPRISRSLPSLREEGISEKRTRFIATVHELFHESVAKRSKENTSEWKKLWKKHALVRTAVGITLAGWAIAATASWAGVLAAGLLATRAIMGAVGGYVAVEWLFDTFGPRLRKHGIDALLQKIETAENIWELDPYISKAIEQIELDNLDKEIEKSKLRNDRFNTVKRFTAATACAALAIIGGSRMAEAATFPHSAPYIAPQSIPVVDPLQQTLPLPLSGPTLSYDIRSIMTDVQHDHPTKCITLEQCVRRIEGLKQGIPLTESEKLQALNLEAYQITRDPQGCIVSAMKELGCLQEWQSVDDVAKILKSEQIESILKKAYSSDIGGTAEIGETPLPVTYESLDVLPSTEISTPKVAEVSAPNVANSSLRDNISATTLEVLGTLGGIGIGVGAGYALRRKYGKKPNQEELEKAYYSPEATITPLDNTPAHTIPNTSTSHSFPTPSTPTSHKKGDAPISTPQNTDIFAHPVPSRNGASLEKIQEEIRSLPVKEQQTILHQLSDCPDEVRDRMARLNAAAYAFQMKLGFSAPKMQMSAEVYGTVTYTLPTIGGEYKIQFFQEEWRAIGVGFQWFDHGKLGYQNGKTLSRVALSDMATFSRELHSISEDLFMEAIVSREVIKQRELRDVHTFEVTHNDLGKIYTQLENRTYTWRGSVRIENETGGAWFQGVYRMNNGVFRFQNLTNPTKDELMATPWEFGVRPDKAADWIMRGMAGAERISSNEQAMIEKIEVMNGGRFGTKFKRIDGNFCLFNWHKHPDGLPHPSSMDIRDSAINVGFPSSPTRLMWSWGIVTVIDKIPETRTPNTLYLTSREFGGERNYQITFWKLRRGETHVSPVNISRV